MKAIVRACAVSSVLLCCAVPAHAEWVRRVTDGIMGTRITVELWAEDAAKAEQAIDAVLDEMRHIDESMSTYKPSSEVSQVNAKAADGPMHIGKELFDLLTTAKEYSVITDGAFDITYASVGYLYDFRKHVRPDDAQIAKALPAVNYQHVILDPKNQTVQFSQKGVRIDLGGIAKGYSVDRGIDVLKSLGYTRAYVGAGGDSRIIGDRFGKPWVVGIRDPSKGEGNVIARIPLVDAAISTSGDYERYFEEKGVRYHHIIDPHTGHSARCEALRSSDRTPPAPTACPRPPSCWGRKRRWKSTTGWTTSMPSSSSSTAPWSIRRGCSAPRRSRPNRASAATGRRSRRRRSLRRRSLRRQSLRRQSRKLLNCSGTSNLALRKHAIASCRSSRFLPVTRTLSP
jgi:thiamine biosynthesis lipoprotein